ncbi:MAG TPA: hypothetical protein VK446_05280 [Methylocystis sp.]|nr:hypothetical protein [Methylocystis sp.]
MIERLRHGNGRRTLPEGLNRERTEKRVDLHPVFRERRDQSFDRRAVSTVFLGDELGHKWRSRASRLLEQSAQTNGRAAIPRAAEPAISADRTKERFCGAPMPRRQCVIPFALNRPKHDCGSKRVPMLGDIACARRRRLAAQRMPFLQNAGETFFSRRQAEIQPAEEPQKRRRRHGHRRHFLPLRFVRHALDAALARFWNVGPGLRQ